jgi:hypothetical protein
MTQTRLGTMTVAEYLRHDGALCPHCHSGDISADPWNDTMSRTVRCMECDVTWTELGKLVDYIDLQDEDGEPITIPDEAETTTTRWIELLIALENHTWYSDYFEFAIPEDAIPTDEQINAVLDAQDIERIGALIYNLTPPGNDEEEPATETTTAALAYAMVRGNREWYETSYYSNVVRQPKLYQYGLAYKGQQIFLITAGEYEDYRLFMSPEDPSDHCEVSARTPITITNLNGDGALPELPEPEDTPED